MPRVINKDRSIKLQKLISNIGPVREPFIETGRKFDKVYVEGKVRYFVARADLNEHVKEGDIFGAKSKLAPNFRWYFGNLANVDKWNWSEFHGTPVNDPSVMAAKSYGRYKHFCKIVPTSNTP